MKFVSKPKKPNISRVAMSLSNAEDSSEQVKNTSTEELETSDKGKYFNYNPYLRTYISASDVSLAPPE